MAFQITGVTKNNSGVPLGSCDVFLFKYNSGTHTLAQVDYVTSNGTTGAYTFSSIADGDAAYMVAAFKDGSPNAFDLTDHNLQPDTV